MKTQKYNYVHLTVRADEVRKGDQVYDSGGFHPSAIWVAVAKTSRIVVQGPGGSGDSIVIDCGRWQSYCHPGEAIAIRRLAE